MNMEVKCNGMSQHGYSHLRYLRTLRCIHIFDNHVLKSWSRLYHYCDVRVMGQSRVISNLSKQ